MEALFREGVKKSLYFCFCVFLCVWQCRLCFVACADNGSSGLWSEGRDVCACETCRDDVCMRTGEGWRIDRPAVTGVAYVFFSQAVVVCEFEFLMLGANGVTLEWTCDVETKMWRRRSVTNRAMQVAYWNE